MNGVHVVQIVLRPVMVFGALRFVKILHDVVQVCRRKSGRLDHGRDGGSETSFG